MKKHCLGILLLFLVPLVYGFDDVLNGSSIIKASDLTDSEFILHTLNTRKMNEYGIKGSSVISFVEPRNEYFALLNDMSLAGAIIQPEKFLGNWPLTRWEGETGNNQFNQFTLPHTDSSFGTELRQEIWSSRKGLGCYNETPLRYGDIESDGEKEIVLLLGEVNHTLDMVVFSPSQGKTVFGVRLAVHDSQENEYGEYSDYDYIATLDLRSAYQASRLYAKVFAGDFNQQDTGTYDLLVWRKAYLANLKTQTPKGFSLNASLLSHFALIEGEYVLQETDQTTIQSWLSENELTWSKGFPSESECEGEEGILIPEMHDPLLNDPDVLQ